jgi:hypothetical protein
MPRFHGKIAIHKSAISTFYAPSDLSGVGGMRREWIRATPSWRGGPARHDCVFVCTDPSLEGMRGLDVARVQLFFSLNFENVSYPCALVHWFSRIGDTPDEDTGLWMVEPDFDASGLPILAVIHIDTILRAAHLIGVCGEHFLPRDFSFNDSLDAFNSFYVNKFADHHAFEIAF